MYQAMRGHLGTAVHDTDSGANGLERLPSAPSCAPPSAGVTACTCCLSQRFGEALLRWEHATVA